MATVWKSGNLCLHSDKGFCVDLLEMWQLWKIIGTFLHFVNGVEVWKAV